MVLGQWPAQARAAATGTLPVLDGHGGAARDGGRGRWRRLRRRGSPVPSLPAQARAWPGPRCQANGTRRAPPRLGLRVRVRVGVTALTAAGYTE